MKTEELTALGISEEIASKVLAINGKDVEHAKSTVSAAKDREIGTLTAERDGLQSQLNTANDTLKKFEGIDPEKIQTELANYKQQAEAANAQLTREITQRDQKDWLKTKLDEYGVKSPLARRQIMADCMSETDGLKWQSEKDGKPAAFFGFDDYMKAAKAEDNTLYQTAEEKAEEEKKKSAEEGAPDFTDPLGGGNPEGGKPFKPPVIF